MAQTGPEDINFRLDDFTAATGWEKAIAKIETLLRRSQGQVNRTKDSDSGNGPNIDDTIKLLNADYRLRVWLNYRGCSCAGTVPEEEDVEDEGDLSDLSTLESDVIDIQRHSSLCLSDSDCHDLHRFFGCRNFALITSASRSEIAPNEARLLLSALVLAIESKSPIGAFVQYEAKHRRFYMGCARNDTRIMWLRSIKPSPMVPEFVHERAGVDLLEDHLRRRAATFSSNTDPNLAPLADLTVHVRRHYRHDCTNDSVAVTLRPAAGGEGGVSHDSYSDLRKLHPGSFNLGLSSEPVQSLHGSLGWGPMPAVKFTGGNETVPSKAALVQAGLCLVDDHRNGGATGVLEALVRKFVHSAQTTKQLASFVDRLGGGDVLFGGGVAAGTGPGRGSSSSSSPLLGGGGGLGGGPGAGPRDAKEALGALTSRSQAVTRNVVGGEILASTVKRAGLVVGKTFDKTLTSLQAALETPPPNKREMDHLLDIVFSASAEGAHGTIDGLPLLLKSTPFDSMGHRLASVLAVLLVFRGGLRGASLFWLQFRNRLRNAWESGQELRNVQLQQATEESTTDSSQKKDIPAAAFSKGRPDLSASLVTQKLQMIQCCIKRKVDREREKAQRSLAHSGKGSVGKHPEAVNTRTEKASSGDWNAAWGESAEGWDDADEDIKLPDDGSDEKDADEIADSAKGKEGTGEAGQGSSGDDQPQSDDEDEFYDVDEAVFEEAAEDEDDDDDDVAAITATAETPSSPKSFATLEAASFAEDATPHGVKHAHATLKLVQHPDIALNIPYTQEPAPFTEDRLHEINTSLAQLGTGLEAQRVRARLQSAGLLSDMEAFKAANPKGIFIDFVRWHSPRDCKELTGTGEDEPKFELSERMRDPENLWHEIWGLARPVPIAKQRLLFNPTLEAERVLHWFDEITTDLLVTELMGGVLQTAYKSLQDFVVDHGSPGTLKESLSTLKQAIEHDCNDVLGTMGTSVDAANYVSSVGEQAMSESLRALHHAEMLCSVWRSLAMRLGPQSQLLQPLVAKVSHSLTAGVAEGQQGADIPVAAEDLPQFLRILGFPQFGAGGAGTSGSGGFGGLPDPAAQGWEALCVGKRPHPILRGDQAAHRVLTSWSVRDGFRISTALTEDTVTSINR
eukprot:Clim_evm28s33 gene=Clim_evmTU28s33